MTTRRTLGVLVTSAVIITLFLMSCTLNNTTPPDEMAEVVVGDAVVYQMVVLEW